MAIQQSNREETELSTKHITTDRRFAALLGWAAKHPALGHEEPRGGISRNRKRSAEYSGTRRTGWGAPLPPEQVAANLSRMSA